MANQASVARRLRQDSMPRGRPQGGRRGASPRAGRPGCHVPRGTPSVQAGQLLDLGGIQR